VVKRPGRESDDCTPTSADAKTIWTYISTHPYSFMAQFISYVQEKCYLLECEFCSLTLLYDNSQGFFLYTETSIIIIANWLTRPPLWSSGQSSWLHNGVVLFFLWGTNWIYICYVEESRPPLCSSGQSSWLHNGDVLWFLWSTNWIDLCYVEESRPPLCSSGQSSGYITELYCSSCEVRTEFIYVM
jgi:hypothetical protein